MNDTVWDRIETYREFIVFWLLHEKRISNLEMGTSSIITVVCIVLHSEFSISINLRKIGVNVRRRGLNREVRKLGGDFSIE